MARSECHLANEECKYYERLPPPELRSTQEHGCFSDIDHVIPQRLAYCALSNYIIKRKENLEQKCRDEHDEKNRREAIAGVPENMLPSEPEMAEIAVEDHEVYGIHLPRSVRRRVNEIMRHVREQQEINNFFGRMT